MPEVMERRATAAVRACGADERRCGGCCERGQRALRQRVFLLERDFFVAGTSCSFCYNQFLLEFDVCGFFCWKQSNLLLEPGVSFATIKFVRVYDLWEFCWNQSNLLLEPAVSFATIKFVGV